jgi:hypothetical protein
MFQSAHLLHHFFSDPLAVVAFLQNLNQSRANVVSICDTMQVSQMLRNRDFTVLKDSGYKLLQHKLSSASLFMLNLKRIRNLPFSLLHTPRLEY